MTYDFDEVNSIIHDYVFNSQLDFDDKNYNKRVV